VAQHTARSADNAAISKAEESTDTQQQEGGPRGVGDLNVNQMIVRNLADADIVVLSEVQRAVVPMALTGQDVIAKSHTGWTAFDFHVHLFLSFIWFVLASLRMKMSSPLST
jgi:superfamily II DNA/RNA helicase